MIRRQSRDSVVVFGVNARTRCQLVTRPSSQGPLVIGIGEGLYQVTVDKRRNQRGAQFGTPFSGEDGLVHVTQPRREKVLACGIAPLKSIGHGHRVQRYANGHAVVGVLPQRPPFNTGLIGFLKGAARDADGQSIGDAIVEGHAHAGVVQPPQSVGAFVDLAKAVGDDKVKYVLPRRLVALDVDDSRVFERSGDRGDDERSDSNAVQKALGLCCTVR